MALRFAYNTNGAANHRLDDALSLIADSGYDGVALTLDHHHFDPFEPDLERRAEALSRRLRELGLGLVIETGARYLLDPRVKHEPTLLNPTPEGRARRIDFLTRCVRIAAICEAEAVSFWAGVPQRGVDPATAWGWLVDGVAQVADAAAEHGVTVALEPEPGMLVETVDDFQRLSRDLSERTSWPLRLALDTGHCLVTGERDPASAVRGIRRQPRHRRGRGHAPGRPRASAVRAGRHGHPVCSGSAGGHRLRPAGLRRAFPRSPTAPTSPSPKASTG